MLREEPECDGPLVVGLGGTLRANSSTERALRHCLEAVERQGGRTKLYCGGDIELPMYNPHDPARTREAVQLIEALREADAVIVGSPGYHGGVSGLVKTHSTISKTCVRTPGSTSTTNPGAALAVLTDGRRQWAR